MIREASLTFKYNPWEHVPPAVPEHRVRGVDTDSETRCVHYRGERDVVGLRFGCCGRYYACHECHRKLVDHDPEPWPAARRGEPAARCGVCGGSMTAGAYLGADSCPNCGAGFNPDCAEHYHLYFQWVSSERR